MSDLGKAYVQIVPSAKGISGSITNLLKGESEAAGRSGGEGYSSRFAAALKSGGAGIVSVGAGIFAGLAGGLIGGAAAAATGFVKTVSQSAYQAYASYEQLTGGVETLFGSAYNSVEEYAEGVGVSMDFAAQTFDAYQGRQQSVMDNANNAYKTAGLSANEYMETVTSFAASLNSSLGEYAWQSANYADMAVSDMADNANKMGSSMESIQNAYQGFAKGNFTMLDNLKLGYGGTKSEMERLLAKAEELDGLEMGSLSVDNFSDIIYGINVIQNDLGITGTTAKEAMTTLEGSSGAVKAAWQNVVTAIGRGEGMEEAFDGLINSLFGENEGEGFLNQVATRIPVIMQGIGELVTTAAPIISEYIPPLIDQVLPTVISTVGTVMGALAEAIPPYLPMIAETFGQLVDTVGQSLSQQFPRLSFVFDNLGTVLKGAFAIFLGGSLISAILPIVSVLGGPLTLAIGAVVAVGVLLYKNWDTIKEKAGQLKDWIGDKWNGIKSKTTEAWENVRNSVSQKWNSLKTTVQNSQIAQVVGKVWDAAKTTMQNSLNAMKSAYDKHGGGLKGAAAAAMEGVKQYYTAGWNFVDNLTGGKLTAIKDKVFEKFDAIKEHIKGALDSIKGFFEGLKLKLPEIKLPHFKLSGQLSLNPPSVPHLSVEWYRKAMNQAYLLDSATIFGANGSRLMGGGEAGSEMIIGTQKLMGMISEAVGDMGGSNVTFNNTFNITAGDRDARELAKEISYYLDMEGRQLAGAWA